MNQVTLNNGIKMPILGFGVFQVPDPEVCKASVAEALRVGYRLIDTAAVYGNEEAVGAAIRESGVPRSELFITTKLWVHDVSYEGAKAACQRSLDKLGLGYLDLLLIHQPLGDVFGAWRAMEELCDQGKIKALGVSNFSDARVMDLLLHARISPAVNQIETHPFRQQPASAEFLKANNVQMEGWGPFAEGQYGIFTNEVLAKIAQRHSKSVAQVVLRWFVQRGVVTIPKSVNKDRIAQNFQVFDFQLTDEDMADIRSLDTNKSVFLDHQNPETLKMLYGFRLG